MDPTELQAVAAETFTTLADEIVDSQFEFYPNMAARQGLHEYDGRVTDFSGDALDRLNLPARRVVREPGADDVRGLDDSLERRLNDFFRRGGDDEELEVIAVDAARETLGQQVDVRLEADAAADLHEVLAAHAAVLGVVQEEVRELQQVRVELRELLVGPFLFLTVLLSAFSYIPIISAGTANVQGGIFVLAMMWSPGLAADAAR